MELSVEQVQECTIRTLSGVALELRVRASVLVHEAELLEERVVRMEAGATVAERQVSLPTQVLVAIGDAPVEGLTLPEIVDEVGMNRRHDGDVDEVAQVVEMHYNSGFVQRAGTDKLRFELTDDGRRTLQVVEPGTAEGFVERVEAEAHGDG